MAKHTRVPALQRQRRSSWPIGQTSLIFILLQSACTVVMAMAVFAADSVMGSLAAASFIPGFIFSIHTDKIRIPMMAIVVFLTVLIFMSCGEDDPFETTRVAMERQPVTAKQRRSETIQIVLSILTLLLVVAEILAHHIYGSFFSI